MLHSSSPGTTLTVATEADPRIPERVSAGTNPAAPCMQSMAGLALEGARQADRRWRVQRSRRLRRYLRLTERLERAEEHAFPWLCLWILVAEPLLLLAAFWLLCAGPVETRNQVEAAFLHGESLLVCAVAVAGVLTLALFVTLPRCLVALLRSLVLRWADHHCIEVGRPAAPASRR